MPESRDRLTRPVDVTARFLRRRLVNGGGIAILIDEPEAVVGTPFRWGATPMTDPHRHVAALALRGGGSAGRGGSRTPRATVGRGQSSHRRPSASVLPSWYPRTPLRDITAVVRTIERRARFGVNEGRELGSPARQIQDQDAENPPPSISTTLDALDFGQTNTEKSNMKNQE